jgi:spore maturation protein CgeB
MKSINSQLWKYMESELWADIFELCVYQDFNSILNQLNILNNIPETIKLELQEII